MSDIVLSIPQQLLKIVKTDLGHINTANGFENDFQTAYNGYIAGTGNNKQCQPFYYLSPGKTLNQNTEDLSKGLIEMELIIGVHFTAPESEGEVNNKCETIINDLTAWANSNYFTLSNMTMPTGFTKNTNQGMDNIYISDFLREFDFTAKAYKAGIAFKVQYWGQI